MLLLDWDMVTVETCLPPTTMLHSKSRKSSPFCSVWTAAGCFDHIHMPKFMELLICDWLISQFDCVPNKIPSNIKQIIQQKYQKLTHIFSMSLTKILFHITEVKQCSKYKVVKGLSCQTKKAHSSFTQPLINRSY